MGRTNKYAKGDKMKVTWEVEDGYCGKHRPQYIEVPDDELEECETEEDREDLINSYVQDAFDQTISWCITDKE
jgi:hypothetical protein